MGTISHSETSLLGKFYTHRENNAPFMTKNVNFIFFPWTPLRDSKKTLTRSGKKCLGLVFPPHFVYEFSRKMFHLLYSVK